MSKFDKKKAREEAVFYNHKYIASYIWGQSHLENECISYISTETFLHTMNLKKLALTYRFEEGDKFSEYTIDLLKGLKDGWDEILYYLKFEDKKSLSINELIHLNDTLSNFEPNKGGKGIRSSPIIIGGCKYKPEAILIASKVEEELNNIWNNPNLSELDRSIEIFLYISKTQVFYDGNKRTALVSASYNLINNGVASGIFINPEKVNEFKRHLIDYYEDDNKKDNIVNFLKKECIQYIPQFKLTEEYQQIFKIVNNKKEEQPEQKPSQSTKHIVQDLIDVADQAVDQTEAVSNKGQRR